MALPMSGPATTAMPKTPERPPMTLARVLGGKTTAAMAMPTGKKPPLPSPWMARKTMSSVRFWLSPERAEPTMKMSEGSEEDVTPAREVRELGEDRDARGGGDHVGADDEGAAVGLPELERGSSGAR